MSTDPSRDDVMRRLMPTFLVPLDGAQIPVDRIVPNPHQPRKTAERPFDPERNEEDAELAQSIRERGVIQPIGVIALPDGRYQLVFGERRWRASLAAGREMIPATILNVNGEVSAEQQAVMALIENLQRADLAPDEICDGIEKLREMTSYDWTRIAHILGKSERTLRYYRRLNDLSSDVRQDAIRARLSIRQIDALASAPPEKQSELFQEIISLGLPVVASRETARTVAQDDAMPVALAARQAAGGHAARPQRSKGWSLTPMHTQIVEAMLLPGEDAAPAQKGAATRRIKALLEQVEAMKLDLVDTRNAALLMSFDPNLPSPSAVAMAQSVRATRVGKALANIQAGLDMLETVGEISGNEEHAIMAILAHLQERIKELSRKRAKRAQKA